MNNGHVDSDYALGPAWGLWSVQENDNVDNGRIWTRHGIIEVYTEDVGKLVRTILHTVIDGRVYTRRWNRAYSRRYCVTLARRFADELVARRDDANTDR